MIPVRIVEIRQETPTVKSLKLDLRGQDFSFHPGQWVDCYAEIDGELLVAGYTLTSSAAVRETIELAVREGDNPVTRFIHGEAVVGDTLHVDGGQGDVYYTRGMGDALVLIAGGIGITPLVSMVRTVRDSYPDVEATLIYSARSSRDLLFMEELDAMAEANERIRCLFTVTGPDVGEWAGRRGRIDRSLIQEAGVVSESLFFISGPAPMAETMMGILRDLGVPPDSIRYEQWW
jgi:ferredoxin-NADP reductase